MVPGGARPLRVMAGAMTVAVLAGSSMAISAPERRSGGLRAAAATILPVSLTGSGTNRSGSTQAAQSAASAIAPPADQTMMRQCFPLSGWVVSALSLAAL